MTPHTVHLGPELFRFDTRLHWWQNGQSWFANSGYTPHEYLCLDAAGRVCTLGRHFARAEREGTYPIVVYLIDGEGGMA